MAFSCCGLVCEIGISLTTYYRRRTLDGGSQTLRRSRTGHRCAFFSNDPRSFGVNWNCRSQVVGTPLLRGEAQDRTILGAGVVEVVTRCAVIIRGRAGQPGECVLECLRLGVCHPSWTEWKGT